MAQYFSVITRLGAALEATSKATGQPIVFTQIAVGDGGGQGIVPGAEMRGLVQERWRGPLNDLYVDPANPATWTAVCVIPENVGGFIVREAGLFTEDGTLYAIGSLAETSKADLSEGSPKTLNIRFPVTISPEAVVRLLIDPSKVLATREYVDRLALAPFGLSVDADKNLILTRFEAGDEPDRRAFQVMDLLPSGSTFAMNENRELIATLPEQGASYGNSL